MAIITEGKVVLSNLKHLQPVSPPTFNIQHSSSIVSMTPFTPHCPRKAFSLSTIDNWVTTTCVHWSGHLRPGSGQFIFVFVCIILQKRLYTLINIIIWKYLVMDIHWFIYPVSRFETFGKWASRPQMTRSVHTGSCDSIVYCWQTECFPWSMRCKGHHGHNAIWMLNVGGETGCLC